MLTVYLSDFLNFQKIDLTTLLANTIVTFQVLILYQREENVNNPAHNSSIYLFGFEGFLHCLCFLKLRRYL